MKMNRIHLSLLLITISLIINSCNNNFSIKYFDETTTSYNLKGKVKKIKSSIYIAKIEGNDIDKGEKIESRLLGKNQELHFNKYGQLINEKQYSKNNKLKSESTFEYNRNGSIKKYKTNEIEVFYYYNENDSIERIVTKGNNYKRILKAEYDNKKRRIKEFVFDNDSLVSLTTHKYNNLDKSIEQNEYNKDNELVNQLKCFYTQEKLIKETYASRDSLKTGIGKISNFYKYQDNKLSEKRTIFNNSHFVSISYNYYSNGIIKKEQELEWIHVGKSTIRINEYDSIGNIILSDIFGSFKYEFDSNNNWIKKIVIQSDHLSYIVYREIEYYQ